MNDRFNDTYAHGKLYDFAYEVFTGVGNARERLSENLHYLLIISPEDFAQEKHQQRWLSLRKMLVGKTKNVGLERNPIDRLTVQNKTLEKAIKMLWDQYEECCERTV